MGSELVNIIFFYGYSFWGREGENSSDETDIKNLINSEKEVICWLEKGNYENIKKCQEVKHTDKIVKLVEGIIKDIAPQMKSEGETRSDKTYILRQVWYEMVFMHFLYVQYLTFEIKSNAL